MEKNDYEVGDNQNECNDGFFDICDETQSTTEECDDGQVCQKDKLQKIIKQISQPS